MSEGKRSSGAMKVVAVALVLAAGAVLFVQLRGSPAEPVDAAVQAKSDELSAGLDAAAERKGGIEFDEGPGTEVAPKQDGPQPVTP